MTELLRSDSPRGFTLTELLVVMTIIALLTGLLVPALAVSRRRAQQSVCVSNLRQIHMAYSAYETDYLDGLFSEGLSTVNMGGVPEEYYDERSDWAGDWTGLWPGQLEPYLKNVEVYECPSADVRWVNTFHPPQFSPDFN